MKNFAILFLLIFSWVNNITAQNNLFKLHGRLIDSSMEWTNNLAFGYISLLDLQKNKIEDKITDVDGLFDFDLDKDKYYFHVVYEGYEDTLFAVQLNGDTSIVFNIHRPCKYDKSLKDRTCPICHNKDMVIPIEYGLLIITKDSTKHSKKWRKKHLKQEKEFYPGGCLVQDCQPHWYCKRDSLEF